MKITSVKEIHCLSGYQDPANYSVSVTIDGGGLTVDEVKLLTQAVVQQSTVMLTFKLEETRKIVTECMIGCGNHRT